MTNEELFTDLKQFIEATMSQQMSQFATKEDIAKLATKDDIENIRSELKTDIRLVDEKLDTIQDAIAETLTHSTETVDNMLQDHGRRLGRLERKAA